MTSTSTRIAASEHGQRTPMSVRADERRERAPARGLVGDALAPRQPRRELIAEAVAGLPVPGLRRRPGRDGRRAGSRRAPARRAARRALRARLADRVPDRRRLRGAVVPRARADAGAAAAGDRAAAHGARPRARRRSASGSPAAPGPSGCCSRSPTPGTRSARRSCSGRSATWTAASRWRAVYVAAFLAACLVRPRVGHAARGRGARRRAAGPDPRARARLGGRRVPRADRPAGGAVGAPRPRGACCSSCRSARCC